MLARMDVPEETKRHLRAARADLDLASLRHEILQCQEHLDEIAKRRQPLVIKKRGNYAYISYAHTCEDGDIEPAKCPNALAGCGIHPVFSTMAADR
jgi:hypothetical protein